MGTKKKINPNKIPINWSMADTQRASDESTREMVLLAWALVLCALADRRDTTSEMLLSFWDAVNINSGKLNTFADVEKRLDALAAATGIRFPFQVIRADMIKTKGDADRLCRRLRSNALSAMFALIADTVMEQELMEQETLCWVFEKVRGRAEDIESGELSAQDLFGVLEDEYALRLVQREPNVMLEPIEYIPDQLEDDSDIETGACRKEARYDA